MFLRLGGVSLLAGFVAVGVLASTAGAESPPAAAPAGQKLFIRCVACHSMSASAAPKTGPHLEGIVGRPVAALPDFKYSAALRAQAFVWDEAKLDEWLTAPQADVAGMCLPFRGFPKAEARAAMIDYLKRH